MLSSTSSAEQQLLEYRKSVGLRGALELVKDASVTGQSKFARATSRRLARMVACRSYASAILELTHLVLVAEACAPRPRSYEALFWGSGPAKAASFRAFITDRSKGPSRRSDAISVEGKAVTCIYPDGQFTISFSRMPLLSALMEFLVTVIGYCELDDHLQAIFENGRSMKSVSRSANAIAKDLYDYLNKEMGSLHEQRKFHKLTTFLMSREGGDFSADSITDDVILDFWLGQPVEEPGNLDFRTFRSVFRAFLNLREALQAALEADGLLDPRPIGSDRMQGEIGPDQLSEKLDAIDERVKPLDLLDEEPARQIKFLTNIERTGLEALLDCGTSLPFYVLSLMRSQVFGDAQARITQDLRMKSDARERPKDFSPFIQETYDSKWQDYETLHNKLEKTLLASMHVLIGAGRSEALELIFALQPDIDLSSIGGLIREERHSEEALVDLDRHRTLRKVLDLLAAEKVENQNLLFLLRAGRQAFKGLSRRGFTESDVLRPEVIEGFATVTAGLSAMKRTLRSFQEMKITAKLPRSGWPQQFEADSGVFQARFQTIYGGAS